MALRTVHIVAMALVLGEWPGTFPRSRCATPSCSRWRAAFSSWRSTREELRLPHHGAGVAAIVKLALVGLGWHLPESRLAFYLAATVIGSVGSHMSGAWRHYSFLDRKVAKQD
ncbi:MAG: hypothetical protein IPP07_30785 [Holophagales bacterium]|nr:hypothetical protein [Holophagales bacterium]